jgi:hypothetical protein
MYASRESFLYEETEEPQWLFDDQSQEGISEGPKEWSPADLFPRQASGEMVGWDHELCVQSRKLTLDEIELAGLSVVS